MGILGVWFGLPPSWDCLRRFLRREPWDGNSKLPSSSDAPDFSVWSTLDDDIDFCRVSVPDPWLRMFFKLGRNTQRCPSQTNVVMHRTGRVEYGCIVRVRITDWPFGCRFRSHIVDDPLYSVNRVFQLIQFIEQKSNISIFQLHRRNGHEISSDKRKNAYYSLLSSKYPHRLGMSFTSFDARVFKSDSRDIVGLVHSSVKFNFSTSTIKISLALHILSL